MNANKNKDDDGSLEDLVERSNDLFEDEISFDKLSSFSHESEGNYMTEQGFFNNLESSLSLVERSAKLQKQIYIELLKLIKPLEQATNFLQRDNSLMDSLAQEFNEDYFIQNNREKTENGKPVKERRADMRNILGFLN